MDEHGKPRAAVKQKAYKMEADKIIRSSGQEKKNDQTNLTEEAKIEAIAVKVPT